METGKVKFFENGEVSENAQVVEIKEIKVNVFLPLGVPSSIVYQNVVLEVEERVNNTDQRLNKEIPIDKVLTWIDQKE